jgi:acyl dehydratase
MTLTRPVDLLDHVGEELGVSDWREIEQAVIDHFADVTDDHQWIHVDTERAAREVPGGRTIAHGLLLLSMLTELGADLFHVEQLSHITNYGLERLRFTAQVPVGTRIRLRRSIADATRRDGGSVRVTFDDVIEIEGSERPAMVARTIWLLHP